MPDKLNIERFFDQFADTRKQASVERVFGAPVASGGKTVIPIASTAFGFGAGGGVSEDESDSNVGGGGGGGYIVRPMAMAVIDADEVRIEPVVNEERVALAGILTGAWAIFWIARVLLRLIPGRSGDR